MPWFVYILETKNGLLYTGITKDITRRMKQHQEGKGAKFTRSFGFKKIVFKERQLSRSKALSREYQIKRLSRARKLEMIKLGKENRMDLKMAKNSGFTLVEIMVVVAIIALLAAIAIPNLMRAKMASNDALAKATVRAISTAAETYATSNGGNYPMDETSLIGATPAYLKKSYCGQTISGYNFGCVFSSGATYTITAAPQVLGSSGSTTYTISTGGVLTP